MTSRRILHPSMLRQLKRRGGGQQQQQLLVPLPHRHQQARSHHPDPFNPKMTRGWKAALAVSILENAHHVLLRPPVTV